LVVLTFVRWVDWIARLGRIGTTIDKVETAAESSLRRRRRSPAFGAVPVSEIDSHGTPVQAETIGYLQHINIDALQACANEHDLTIHVAALPGTFLSRGRPLAYIEANKNGAAPLDHADVAGAFHIGNGRVFDDDPRFALIALSEIASRALSPAVNDPGTAIEIIGAFVRLFAALVEPLDESEGQEPTCERVRVPHLKIDDMLDDAFRPIARDGASNVEVQIRLQKALASLAALDNQSLRSAAARQSRQALARARSATDLPDDVQAVTDTAAWSESA
jgi:uncharacterized membrane protein